MAAGIPPPPLNSPQGSYYWLEWYTQLTNVLNGTGYPWTALNFSGSNIHDIATRNHNSLQNIQGGNAAGDPGGSGYAYHMLGVGYVDASVTNPKLPSGWSVVNNSTGVYTITMPNPATPPDFMAGATSNSSGSVVQWIDVTGTTTFVVHITTSGGVTPQNANFSFWVTII